MRPCGVLLPAPRGSSKWAGTCARESGRYPASGVGRATRLPEHRYHGEPEDLIDEVRDYIEEYWAEIDSYRKAPNRASHFPYLMRAHLADRSGDLLDVLLAEPSDAATGSREEALAPA